MGHLSGDYVLFDQSLTGPGKARTDVGKTIHRVLSDASEGTLALYGIGSEEREGDFAPRMIHWWSGNTLRKVLGAPKMVDASLAKALSLRKDGPLFQVELTAKLLRARIRIEQVAVPQTATGPRVSAGMRLRALALLIQTNLRTTRLWKANHQIPAAVAHKTSEIGWLRRRISPMK